MEWQPFSRSDWRIVVDLDTLEKAMSSCCKCRRKLELRDITGIKCKLMGTVALVQCTNEECLAANEILTTAQSTESSSVEPVIDEDFQLGLTMSGVTVDQAKILLSALRIPYVVPKLSQPSLKLEGTDDDQVAQPREIPKELPSVSSEVISLVANETSSPTGGTDVSIVVFSKAPTTAKSFDVSHGNTGRSRKRPACRNGNISLSRNEQASTKNAISTVPTAGNYVTKKGRPKNEKRACDTGVSAAKNIKSNTSTDKAMDDSLTRQEQTLHPDKTTLPALQIVSGIISSAEAKGLATTEGHPKSGGKPIAATSTKNYVKRSNFVTVSKLFRCDKCYKWYMSIEKLAQHTKECYKLSTSPVELLKIIGSAALANQQKEISKQADDAVTVAALSNLQKESNKHADGTGKVALANRQKEISKQADSTGKVSNTGESDESVDEDLEMQVWEGVDDSTDSEASESNDQQDCVIIEDKRAGGESSQTTQPSLQPVGYSCSICHEVFNTVISCRNHQLNSHYKIRNNQDNPQVQITTNGKQQPGSTDSSSAVNSALPKAEVYQLLLDQSVHKNTALPCTAMDSKQNGKACQLMTISKGPYICPQCSKPFKSYTSLYSHKRNVHNSRNILCCYCNKAFKTTNARNMHQLRHKSGNHQCLYCGKVFKHASNLRKHELVEQGINNVKTKFMCRKCNKRFANEEELMEHKRDTHSQLLPFPCPKCWKSFANELQLTYHSEYHKDDWTWRCEVCSHLYKNLACLNAHKKASNHGFVAMSNKRTKSNLRESRKAIKKELEEPSSQSGGEMADVTENEQLKQEGEHS